MKEYRFYVYFYSNGLATDSTFHTVIAKNYRSAYDQLLAEIPHNYTCDYFCVSPTYRVNGKMRRVK